MITFDVLWDNHPWLRDGIERPCSGGFDNQCAIRLGVTLTRAGVSLASYRGASCWFGHGRQHPLRAEELKLWLNGPGADFAGTAKIARRSTRGPVAHHSYLGRTGIMLWRNFWGRGNQGDHIDLWNGEQIAHGTLDFFTRSEEVWFWEMA
jgi:Type VI secretion system (T6SS), amidase effector protein 4